MQLCPKLDTRRHSEAGYVTGLSDKCGTFCSADNVSVVNLSSAVNLASLESSFVSLSNHVPFVAIGHSWHELRRLGSEYGLKENVLRSLLIEKQLRLFSCCY